MRNRFSIVRTVGLLFLGLGLSVMGMTIWEFTERLFNRYSYNESIWDDSLAAIFINAFIVFFVGVLGLLKHKHFPKAATLTLIATTGMFSWLLLAYMIPDTRGKTWALTIGSAVLVYCMLFSLILLMNNEKFLKLSREKDDPISIHDDILDA